MIYAYMHTMYVYVHTTECHECEEIHRDRDKMQFPQWYI
jgi:hypothetical protein